MGRPVRAMVRNKAKAEIRLNDVADKIDIVEGDVTKRDSLTTVMQDVTTVIHYVAIAMEKGGQTYEDINYQGTVNLIDVAQEAGVKRFINMSQNGAKSDSPYRFLASKGRAQEYVAQSNLQWTALRPSAIFGSQDEFFNTFARLLKITPIIFPLIGGGKAEFQPISVVDVVEAVIRCLDDDSTIGKELVLGGTEVLTLGEIEKRIIEAMGTSRLLVPVPVFLLRPAVIVMQNILSGSPVSTSLLDMLAVPNTVKDNALVTHFGIEPIPFSGEHLQYLNDNTIGDTFAKFFKNATVN
jgi:NADH dehydrogenase